MVNTRRWTPAVAVALCLVTAQGSLVFAAESDSQPLTPAVPLSSPLPTVEKSRSLFNDLGLTTTSPLGYLAPGSRGMFDGMPAAAGDASAFAAQIYRGRPVRTVNRDGSIAAIMLGAAATITGAALLIYANRPDCGFNPEAGGCGYGTKVVGGAVLTGGIAGLMVGALTWR
jgi:hypothetical protein